MSLDVKVSKRLYYQGEYNLRRSIAFLHLTQVLTRDNNTSEVRENKLCQIPKGGNSVRHTQDGLAHSVEVRP